MKKIVKLIITIIVTILIVLYFLRYCTNQSESPCNKFDTILSNRIEQYFTLNYPKSEGEILSVSVNELIADGYLMLDDLENVGTSCSGNAYASRVDDKVFYYNNITCGSCSIDSLYGSWSDWQEILPTFNLDGYQIMSKILYNYSNSEKKYSDWSDWGENVNSITKPSIPQTAVEVDREYDENNQVTKKYLYSYTSTTSAQVCSEYKPLYKCYKNTAGSKYDSQYVYTSSSSAISACNAAGYLNCSSSSQTKTTSWTKSVSKCAASSYPLSSGTKSTVSSDCSGSVVSNPTCNASNVGKTFVTACSATKWKPTNITCSASYSWSSTSDIETQIYTNSGTCRVGVPCPNTEIIAQLNYSSGTCPSTYNTLTCNASNAGKQQMISCNPIKKFCSYSNQYGDADCPYHNAYLDRSNNVCIYEVNVNQKCYGNNTHFRTSYAISYQTCQQGDYAFSSGTTGAETTSCTVNKPSSCSSSTAGTYVSSCAPSKWEQTQKTCTATYAYGSPTTQTVTTDCSGAVASPTCSSASDIGKEKITCTAKTSETLYKFSGNKSEKTYYNNGATYTSCPKDYTLEATGKRSSTECASYTQTTSDKVYYLKADGSATAEKSLATYLSESEYNALKSKNSNVAIFDKTNISKDVVEKKLIRYRIVYTNNNSLVLDDWLPLEEFEKKTSKKLEDFEKDSNITVRKKVLYRYRLKK